MIATWKCDSCKGSMTVDDIAAGTETPRQLAVLEFAGLMLEFSVRLSGKEHGHLCAACLRNAAGQALGITPA